MKILVTGDSHTNSIELGVARLRRKDPARLAGFTIKVRPLGNAEHMLVPFFERRETHVEITHDAFRHRIGRIPLPFFEDAGAVLVSAPLHSALVYNDPAWDGFALPGVEGGGAPVSRALLARIVDDSRREMLAFLSALQSLGLNPLVLEPPRPFRHHEAVGRMGEAKVLAIDGFLRTRVRAALARAAIPVVAVPDDLVEADGFMREVMAKGEGDQHHGNEMFGARMVKELLRMLEPARDTPAGAASEPA